MDAQTKYSSVLVAYYAGVTTDLPPVSPFARELARLPLTASVQGETLFNAYRTDPFLCAKLLGVANSIFFNFDHQTICTLDEAFARVGHKYARNLLVEAPQLADDVDGQCSNSYWAHCMSVAHMARRVADIAREAPFEPDAAYAMGMIHDIGYLLQIHYSPGLFPAVVRALEHSEPGCRDDSHAHHGEELARFWSLPASAVAAIKHHHCPNGCDNQRGRWLSRVILLSEMLSSSCARETKTVPRAAEIDRCIAELSIPRADLESVVFEGARIHGECVRIAKNGGESLDTLFPRGGG